MIAGFSNILRNTKFRYCDDVIGHEAVRLEVGRTLRSMLKPFCRANGSKRGSIASTSGNCAIMGSC